MYQLWDISWWQYREVWGKYMKKHSTTISSKSLFKTVLVFWKIKTFLHLSIATSGIPPEKQCLVYVLINLLSRPKWLNAAKLWIGHLFPSQSDHLNRLGCRLMCIPVKSVFYWLQIFYFIVSEKHHSNRDYVDVPKPC
jgi:hypothetical protein